MATLYWYDSIGGNGRDTIANWWTNALHTVPAGAIPINTDDINIIGPYLPNNPPSMTVALHDLDTSGCTESSNVDWSSSITVTDSLILCAWGSNINHSFHGTIDSTCTATINGQGILASTATINGNAIFTGTDYDFNPQQGTITGEVIFTQVATFILNTDWIIDASNWIIQPGSTWFFLKNSKLIGKLPIGAIVFSMSPKFKSTLEETINPSSSNAAIQLKPPTGPSLTSWVEIIIINGFLHNRFEMEQFHRIPLYKLIHKYGIKTSEYIPYKVDTNNFDKNQVSFSDIAEDKCSYFIINKNINSQMTAGRLSRIYYANQGAIQPIIQMPSRQMNLNWHLTTNGTGEITLGNGKILFEDNGILLLEDNGFALLEA